MSFSFFLMRVHDNVEKGSQYFAYLNKRNMMEKKNLNVLISAIL